MKRKIWVKNGAVLTVALMIAGSVFSAPRAVVHGENKAEQNKSVITETGAVSGKEEVVYSLLQADGTIADTYVVNILNVTKAGTFRDEGAYEEIKNLTNTQPLTSGGNVIEGAAKEGRFYYQGMLKDAQLPWHVQVDYSIDGQKVSAADVGGESGHLKMRIRTTQNEKAEMDFYDNYMLQITVTLNSDSCSNIEAEGGTPANAGSDKMITFTTMPGADGDMTVEADVTEFEMDGISIAAVPFSMDSFNIDLGDISEMTDGLKSLADAIEQLNDGVDKLSGGSGELSGGVKELSDGMTQLAGGMKEVYSGSAVLADGVKQVADGNSELSGGAKKMSKGSAEFKSGIDELSSNSKELTEGSAKIYGALKYIEQSLNGENGDIDLEELMSLPAGLRTAAAGLDEMKSGVDQMTGGYSQGYQTLDGVVDGIPDAAGAVTAEAVAKLYAAAGDDSGLVAALDELVANYEPAQRVKVTYGMIKPAFEAVDTNLPILSGSLDTASTGLKYMADELDKSLKNIDVTAALTELSQGIGELTTQYGQFHKGLKEYTSGVDQLSAGYKELDSGIKELASGSRSLAGGASQAAAGIKELSSGLGEIAAGGGTLAAGSKELASGSSKLSDGMGELADGTDKMHEETKEMPNEIEDTMDELLDVYDTSDFEPVSFAGGGDITVDAVQFVIQTAGIEKPEVEEEVVIEEKKETIWTRFIELFSF